MNLAASMSLDTQGFNTQARQATQTVQGVGQTIRRALGPLLALTGGFLTARGAIRSFRGAIEDGARLEQLRQQTGESVRDLKILEQAFDDAGMGAAAVPDRIRRLHESLSTLDEEGGKGQRRINELGLDLEQLRGMGAAEQMQTIGEAIAGLDHHADRTRATMDIFGQRGQDMLRIFESGAIDDAGQFIGAQADILERNSAVMERVSTGLSRIGNQFQGLALGFADEVLSSVVGPLENLNNLDLSELGRNLGRAIAPWIEALTSGDIWELMWLHAQRMVVRFAGNLISAPVNAARMMWTAFRRVTQEIGESLGDGLYSAALRFRETMLKALMDIGNSRALDALAAIAGTTDLLGSAREGIGQMYITARRESREHEDRMDARGGLGERIKQGLIDDFAKMELLNLGADWAKAFDGPIARLMEGLQERVAANQAIERDTTDSPSGSGVGADDAPTGDDDEEVGSALANFTNSITQGMEDRFARLGLFVGGAGGPELDYARRTATATEKVQNEIHALRQEMSRRPQGNTASWG